MGLDKTYTARINPLGDRRWKRGAYRYKDNLNNFLRSMYNFVHVLLMLNGKNCRQHHNCVMFEANVIKGRHKKKSRNDISLTS